jgi:hypothetical protein
MLKSVPGTAPRRFATSIRRLFAVVGLALPLSLDAQAPAVVSTFGPGYAFDTSVRNGTAVVTNQSLSQRFEFAGPSGYALSQIRLALLRSPFAIDYKVSLWSGPDMGTASLLESWNVNAAPVEPFAFSAFDLFVMQSTVAPALTDAGSYWISVEAATEFGGWAANSQGIVGVYAYILPPRPNWTSITDTAFAFEVTAIPGVVPEPASIALLGAALLVLLPIARVVRPR